MGNYFINPLLKTGLQKRTGSGSSTADKINSGGDATVNGSNPLQIDISAINYTISGNTYNIATQSAVVLSAADATYDRIDAIYADSTGLHALSGTAGENPVAPTLISGQLLVTYILVSAGGGASVGYNVLYVSPTYGNNYTAKKNDISRPYSTLTYAKSQATSTDIIFALPGQYNERNLFGNYRYYFAYGADVVYTGVGSIFNQAPGICTVRGHGRFVCTNQLSSDAVPVRVGSFVGSQLDIECESIESYYRAVILDQNVTLTKPHKIKANKIYSQTLEAVRQNANAHGTVECPNIYSDSTTVGALGVGNGYVGSEGTYIKRSRITNNNYATLTSTAAGGIVKIEDSALICKHNDALGHGIYNPTTQYFTSLTIKNTRIEVTHADATWFAADNSATPQNVLLDNNVTTNATKGVSGSSVITYLSDDVYVKHDNSESTIDITGLTSIDLKAYQDFDKIILTSTNATETINTITNAPKHHSFKLSPENGLSVTFTGTGAGTATENQIVLEAASLVVDGTLGQWAELRNEKFGTGSRIVNSKIYI